VPKAREIRRKKKDLTGLPFTNSEATRNREKKNKDQSTTTKRRSGKEEIGWNKGPVNEDVWFSADSKCWVEKKEAAIRWSAGIVEASGAPSEKKKVASEGGYARGETKW